MALQSAAEASKSRPLMLWAGVVTGLSLVVRTRWAPMRSFDVDELQHMHSAYLVHAGLVPYRDFFDHYTPWLHYALAPILPLCGESVAALVAARAVMLAIAAVVLYLTYRLGHEVYGRLVGAIGAVFLAYTLAFVETTAEIRPDVPAAACWLTSMWFLARAERTASGRALLWAGVWLGAGLMFTPNVLFGAVGMAMALSVRLCDGQFGGTARHRRRMALGFVAGVTAPVLSTMLVLQAQGALVQFVDLTVVMNARWPRELSPLPIARRIVALNPYLVALAIVGSMVAAAGFSRRGDRRGGEGVLVLATVALVGGLFVHPAPYRQYFLLLLPLLSIFAARVVGLALALPPVSVRRALRSGSGASILGGIPVVALAGGVLLCGAAVVALQRTDGITFVAQVFMWPAFVAVAAVAGISHRPVRVGLVAAILVATCMLSPLGVLRTAIALLSILLPALAWTLKGRPLACAAMMSGIVAYPLSVMAAEPLRLNDAQRVEIQYVLDTTAPDDVVQGGWTMTTLFRRGASYYTVVPLALQALVPGDRLGPEILRAVELRKPILIENDAALGGIPSLVDYIDKNYQPTDRGPLFRRKDAPAE